VSITLKAIAKSCMMASCLCLVMAGPAQARDRYRYDYVLDYPLLRPFLGPAPYGGYGYGYGAFPGGAYGQPVAGGYEPGGLVKANDLIDGYVAEQRTRRELAELRRANQDLRERVVALERELDRKGSARRRRSR
jgi:hypothetical protein